MTSVDGVRPLLDETPASEDGEPARIVARRCVPEDEPFFAGHFPATPVVPGVFVLEALAECVRRVLGPGTALASAPLVKFRRRVSPGDTLDLVVAAAGGGGGRRRFDAVASVDGQRAVEATLEFLVETRGSTAE